MFYSPTKEFVRFSTYRTEEIKALKDRIQREKVTADQIASTQLRLQKLKKQYDLLHQHDHSELKAVLQNSEVAISQLLQEKAEKMREAENKIQELAEAEDIHTQLQQKGSQCQLLLRGQIGEKEELLAVKQKNDQLLLLLDKEHCSLIRERDNHRNVKEEAGKTEADINSKWDQYWKEMEDCRLVKDDLTHQVYGLKEECQNLKAQWQFDQKEIEKVQILIQKSKLKQEFLQLNIASLTAQRHKQNQYECMLSQEKDRNGVVTDILDTISEETSRVEREEISCQKQIKDTLTRVSQEQDLRTKIQQKIATARLSLKQLKDKNDSLKTKMNSIYKNDAELIKTISSKRVYPNCKPEVIEILKSSISRPFDSKENISLPLPNKPQSPNNSLNLLEVHRIL